MKIKNTEKSEYDLKPCPFCGGSAKINSDNFIYCEDVVGCGAQIESGPSGEMTLKFTIDAWNRRCQ